MLQLPPPMLGWVKGAYQAGFKPASSNRQRTLVTFKAIREKLLLVHDAKSNNCGHYLLFKWRIWTTSTAQFLQLMIPLHQVSSHHTATMSSANDESHKAITAFYSTMISTGTARVGLMVDTAIFARSKRERNRARKSALETAVKKKSEQVSPLPI